MNENQITDFLRSNGPSTPAQFAKYANITLLFASAMLGDIVSKGLAKTSHLKIGGGSPLYYLEEQKDRLQDFSSRLGNKERQAYEELKNKKILRDKELSPLSRLSLRTLKDFAVGMHVKINGNEEIFWRYYLIDAKEAESIIRNIISQKDNELEQRKKFGDLEVDRNLTKTNTEEGFEKEVKQKPLVIQQNNNKPSEVNSKNIEHNKKDTAIHLYDSEINSNAFNKNIDIEKKTNPAFVNSKKGNEPDASQQILVHERMEGVDLSSELATKYNSTNSKHILLKLSENKISILKYDIVKKNKEYNLFIGVPTALGTIACLAKIIDKKKITEGEIALFIIETQNKGMPGIIITPKESVKKIQNKIDTEFKKINFVLV